MRFSIDRDALLKPLQAVHGVVERRQALPILSNVLIQAQEGTLSLTGTDTEVELVARTAVGEMEAGEITVPARKFLDICRALPNDANVDFAVDGERVAVRSGRSRFTLTTLSASDYPSTDELVDATRLKVGADVLKRLIDLTQFGMAQQDVRYYLNGMLFELGPETLRTVATDGHRLALAEGPVEGIDGGEGRQLILPRKAVLELARIVGSLDGSIELVVGANAIQLESGDICFTSKLIDGKFPDYRRVIPDKEASDKTILADRELLRSSLSRAAILSNEKYRAVRLCLAPGQMTVVASNPEQEEAEDTLEVDYDGEELEIGFNVSYLIDALSTVPSESVQILLTDAASSCLILPEEGEGCEYVVMPMRL
ncbi:MAG: DNA polymerase III subunit beta [Pseudomonadota bacterium]